MARTITEIQNEIIAAVQADSNLSEVNSASSSAIWRLWTRVVASSIWLLEVLFDAHKTEVNENVARLKPHSARWYQNKALSFQYGIDLPEGSDEYDNTLLDEDEIEQQQIIAQAAVVESSSILIVKIAKEVTGELQKLDTDEYDAFSTYINEVKDAGVSIEVLSFDADSLKLEIDLYYDPLVLSSTGARLDGSGETPVQDAIKAFLRDLPFNGEFIKAKLVDALQELEGVFVPEIRSASAARFGNASYTGIDIRYQPYSGFFKFYDEENDLIINFISQDA